jgi:hypothetical protein
MALAAQHRHSRGCRVAAALTCMAKVLTTTSPRRFRRVESSSARSNAVAEAMGYSPPTPYPKMAWLTVNMMAAPCAAADSVSFFGGGLPLEHANMCDPLPSGG